MHTVPTTNTKRLTALAALVAALVAGLCALAHPASAAATTLAVNPFTGNDANPGTATRPLKTLSKALSKAVAGDTVKLAGGGYGQGASGTGNGEQIPATGLLVPSGVTIDGTTENGFPVSTLLGQGAGVGLRFAGNATVRNLFVGGGAGFGIGLYAKQGRQTLSNLFIPTRFPASATVDGITFNGGHGIFMRGTAQTTLTAGASQANTTGSTIFLLGNGGTGVSVNEQARFTMDGGSITGGDQPNCRTAVAGIRLRQSAQASLNGVVPIKNIAGVALAMDNASQAIVSGTLITRNLASACTPPPSVDLNGSPSLTVRASSIQERDNGQKGIGIRADSAAVLTLLKNSRVTGFAKGIEVRGESELILDGGGLASNLVGIDGTFAEGSITVTNSNVSASAFGTGIVTPTLKLRSSELTDSATGIVVTGTNVDLGTATSPGLNTIRNNFTGVRIANTVISDIVPAEGNTWEPNTQGANSSGTYTSPLLVTGRSLLARGKNFDVAQLTGKPNVGIRVGPAASVGAFKLSPRTLTARPGRTAVWKLAWTHPVDWKRLDLIVLRLEHHAKPIGRVVVDQETRRLRATGTALQLVPASSAVSRGQAGGKRVTARLALRIARRYAGRTLVAKVAASDDGGARQGFRRAGRVRVLDR